jgi:hypothetical protein
MWLSLSVMTLNSFWAVLIAAYFVPLARMEEDGTGGLFYLKKLVSHKVTGRVTHRVSYSMPAVHKLYPSRKLTCNQAVVALCIPPAFICTISIGRLRNSSKV